MLKKTLLACGLFAGAIPAQADELSAFVEANILGIFYHEVGHAIIHTENVPIFGQEEDAADVFSIFVVDALYDEETAQSLARDMAAGFEGEALVRDRDGDDIAWWDTHGPDEQRTYNMACLFYGADPDNREKFAAEVDLPEERAESCAEEYDQASASWGAILNDMTATEGRPRLGFTGDAESPVARLIAEETRNLNGDVRLTRAVGVVVESCGEANAFYDPEALKITFCTEFVNHLRQIEALLE